MRVKAKSIMIPRHINPCVLGLIMLLSNGYAINASTIESVTNTSLSILWRHLNEVVSMLIAPDKVGTILIGRTESGYLSCRSVSRYSDSDVLCFTADGSIDTDGCLVVMAERPTLGTALGNYDCVPLGKADG